MSTAQNLEPAIRQLPRDELIELHCWLTAFIADVWDQQITADVSSGRLDALYQSLQKENAGQPDVPLDEVLYPAKFPQATT